MASGAGAGAGLPPGVANLLKPASAPTTLNPTPYTGLLVSFLPILGEPISEGATARVFLVYSEGKFYIIKRIKPQFLDKFRKEVGFLIRLQKSDASPYVVQYLADIETDKGCFILFPYIHGMTLHKWLAEGHSDEDKATMKERVRVALTAIHAQGIIHGDIKANNIWVPTDGYPFLYDFGESGARGDPVTIARARFGAGRAVDAEVLSPNFNVQQLDIAFAPPLVQQAAPIDALSARINQIINSLHTPPSAGVAAVAAEAVAHGFVPSVLMSAPQVGGYRKKSRSRPKRPAKTRAKKRKRTRSRSQRQK